MCILNWELHVSFFIRTQQIQYTRIHKVKRRLQIIEAEAVYIKLNKRCHIKKVDYILQIIEAEVV